MKRMIMTMAAVVTIAGAVCLAQERDTPESMGDFATLFAGEKVWAGNVVGVWTNGAAYMVTTTNVAPLTVLGRAEATVHIGQRLTVKRGTFRFPNNGVTAASLGKAVYSNMDTNGVWGVSGAGSLTLGVLADIDDGGAWVRVGK